MFILQNVNTAGKTYNYTSVFLIYIFHKTHTEESTIFIFLILNFNALLLIEYFKVTFYKLIFFSVHSVSII